MKTSLDTQCAQVLCSHRIWGHSDLDLLGGRKMRKTLLGFVALALCVAFSGVSAHAQTAVDLFIGPGAVTFTTTAEGSAATASFSGTGFALSGSPFGTYNYSLTGSPVTLTQTTPGNFTASSTPLTLTLTGTGFTTGSLVATVDLTSFKQSGGVGIFNNSFIANVTVTSASGSLAGYSGVDGKLILTLILQNGTSIDDLGMGNSSGIFGGTGFMLPTPEPSSLLLFGTGLLALGGGLRRRLLGA